MNSFSLVNLRNIHGWHMLLVKDVALIIVEVALDIKGPAVGFNTMTVGLAMGIHNRGIASMGIVNRGISSMTHGRGSVAMNSFSLEYLGNMHSWHMLLVEDVALVIVEVALDIKGPAVGVNTMAIRLSHKYIGTRSLSIVEVVAIGVVLSNLIKLIIILVIDLVNILVVILGLKFRNILYKVMYVLSAMVDFSLV